MSKKIEKDTILNDQLSTSFTNIVNRMAYKLDSISMKTNGETLVDKYKQKEYNKKTYDDKLFRS